MNSDSEAQNDELLALESIYGDAFVNSFLPSEGLLENGNGNIESEVTKGGRLKITIELPDPFYITFKNGNSKEKEEMKHQIEHLPPIYMHFTFPDAYPSLSPPLYTLSCKWLDRYQLSLLCQRLDTLWKENSGNEVMFTWAQCLKEETLEQLNLGNSLNVCKNSVRRLNSCITSAAGSLEQSNPKIVSEVCEGAVGNKDIVNLDPRAVQDINPTASLLCLLREYDEEMRKAVFDSKLYRCKVCFLDKSGSNSIEFWPCHHVYCKECMKSYFEVQIKEGNIKYLKCPEEKCESEANPKQVESLVSFELYHKWDSMLLSSTLSSLGDIQPCPRQHCQYPVTIEDNQGHCPSCSFVFCGLCRYGWHGLEKCKFKSSEAKKILEMYMKGTIDEKNALEDRYGKKYLKIMVDEYLSITYMKDNAKECPRCRTNIEKTDGCNKMTCKRCDANFCWLCEKPLDRVNPYHHFNNPSSRCFNMLFHGIEFDNDFEFNFDEEEEDNDDNVLLFD